MRRPALVALIACGAVLVVLAGWTMSWPTEMRLRYNQIALGMGGAEVDAILGPPKYSDPHVKMWRSGDGAETIGMIFGDDVVTTKYYFTTYPFKRNDGEPFK